MSGTPLESRILVEHLFRKQSGRIIAAVLRVVGRAELELAQDILQDTLISALRLWPVRGVPDSPEAWLMTVARNRALDYVRHRTTAADKAEALRVEIESVTLRFVPQVLFPEELDTDLLGMLFACCHPEVSEDSRVPLALNVLCGFSASEIAHAFLIPEPTMAQRLVRAKRRIRDAGIRLDLPEGDGARRRLASVLDAIYFLFNEGYNAHGGVGITRADLCAEALGLARLLVRHPIGDLPHPHALLALLCFLASRLPARTEPSNDLLLLPDQDRARWDRQLIAEGFAHLEKAARGNEITEYHLQAGIASCHAMAPSFSETNWPMIVEYYDQLVALNSSPVILLNRLVAVSWVSGPKAVLSELLKLESHPAMSRYYLYHATRGDIHRRLGDQVRAAECYRRAAELTENEAERRFLLGRN